MSWSKPIDFYALSCDSFRKTACNLIETAQRKSQDIVSASSSFTLLLSAGGDAACFLPLGLVLEGWHEQMQDPLIQLLGQGRVGMHWEPDILPIAPDVVREANHHGRRAWRVALPQAFVGHDKVIKAP